MFSRSDLIVDLTHMSTLCQGVQFGSCQHLPHARFHICADCTVLKLDHRLDFCVACAIADTVTTGAKSHLFHCLKIFDCREFSDAIVERQLNFFTEIYSI